MDNKTILVLNGPNLNLLGIREPGVYGSDSYEAVCGRIREKAAELGLRADCDQSNSEGGGLWRFGRKILKRCNNLPCCRVSIKED